MASISSPRIMASIKNSAGLAPFDAFHGRIQELYYVACPGNIRVPSPPGNPKAVRSLKMTDCVCYGIGSLFTSIIAGLLPVGNGSAVLSNRKALKVLMVNGGADRETHGFDVMDYVKVVFAACVADAKKSGGGGSGGGSGGGGSGSSASSASSSDYQYSDAVNCVIVLDNGTVPMECEADFDKHGITVVRCSSSTDNNNSLRTPFALGSNGSPKYDPVVLARCLLDTQATHALKQQRSN